MTNESFLRKPSLKSFNGGFHFFAFLGEKWYDRKNFVSTVMEKQQLTILSWNVNGIRAVHKKGLFLPFIEKYQPDILCLQETKAFQGQAEIDLSDYEEYWNSAERKGYSGTAIFTKIKPLSVINGIFPEIVKRFHLDEDGYGDLSKEGRVITAEYENFFLVTVYTPNAKEDLSRLSLRANQWDPAFLAFCQELEKKKPVIFCGDLNVAHTEDDLANPKGNIGKHGFTDEERAGFSRFVEAGFVDVFRLFHQGKGFYSWWSYFAHARTRNIGWRIDYFLASQKIVSKIVDVSLLSDVLGSDHCPVSITASL